MIGIWRFLVGALALSAAAAALIPPAQAEHAKKHSHAAAARAKKHKPAAAMPAQAAKPAANPAASPAATRLGTVDAWTAYMSRDHTGRVCYLIGQPQTSEPAGFARKSPMAMVTHRPSEKIANVVSFVEGYPLKPDSEVSLDIGTSKFELFTKDDSAWARTAELDRAIVAALGKARQAVVRGVPQKGPATTDVFPLAGFARALALIDKACGVKR